MLLICFGLVLLLPPQGSRTAGCAKTPECLVRILTYETGTHLVLDGGGVTEDRSAALRLVDMGSEAMPVIERALDSVEAKGKGPKSGVSWLLYALARIQPRAAYERLQRMLRNPQMWQFEDGIERAMAISLELTSFRTSLHSVRASPPVPGFGLPQDALDQLMLAWMLNDRNAFEAILSSQARSAFLDLLGSGSWETLRESFLLRTGEPIASFGYRVPLPSGLVRLPEIATPVTMHSGNPTERLEAEVLFFDGDRICGKAQVRFLLVKDQELAPGFWRYHYVVDNKDMGVMLRSLTPCIFQPSLQ